jgi:uncharacterized protein YprB with RNaseH-like and TPR domain
MQFEDRLKDIENLILGKKTAQAKKSWQKGLPELLGGELNRNIYGECIVVEKEFEADLEEVFEESFEFKGETVARLANDLSLSGFDIQKTVFLDTETTGLAGGTGTYAFLVGLGFFKNDLFKLKQYFMRDLHEEKALLLSLQKDLERFDFVVSYNGKRYDIPLLNTRFIVNRIRFESGNLLHLDLLYPTRRVWKRRLADCSLSNVESRILNVYRKSDVPGEMVPQIYFDFIRLGETQLLKRVFDHNAYDIVSMVSLLKALCICFDNPETEKVLDPVDLYSLGRFHFLSGETQKSIRFFNLASQGSLDDELTLETGKLCSLAHKKLGGWREAEEIWLNLIKKHPENFFSYEELAKYYEHKVKDYPEALSFVNKAIKRIDINSFLEDDFKTKDVRDSFSYRKRRLERKLKPSL